jgi:glutathione S-transferase
VPSKRLAPPNGTIERTKLQAWLNFFSSEMHKGGFGPLFYKGISEESKEVFRRRLTARFTHLDRHLAQNDYLMGKVFTVADAHFFVVSNWASRVGFDLSSYANVLTYRKRIADRPAVRAATQRVRFPDPTISRDQRGGDGSYGSRSDRLACLRKKM